jgi:hypothetical protein
MNDLPMHPIPECLCLFQINRDGPATVSCAEGARCSSPARQRGAPAGGGVRPDGAIGRVIPDRPQWSVGPVPVGAGPTLDYADAAEFLAGIEPLIEKVRRRRLQ